MLPNWNLEFHQTRQFLMENEGTYTRNKMVNCFFIGAFIPFDSSQQICNLLNGRFF